MLPSSISFQLKTIHLLLPALGFFRNINNAAVANIISGKLDIEITACREAKLSTVSGASEIKLPADGGTIRFTTTSGSLETQRAFQKQENFYGFGPGDCRIIVESVSGNLRVA